MRRILPFVPSIILIATTSYVAACWDGIPSSFPIHWGLNGEPNGWASKSAVSVFGPIVIGLVLSTMLVRMARSDVRQRLSLSAAAIGAAAFMAAISLLPLLSSSRLLAVVVGIPVITAAVAIAVGPKQPEHAAGERWIWGMFYYNPEDPSLMVPKRFGIGWTINFAHRSAWYSMAALLATPLLFTWLVR